MPGIIVVCLQWGDEGKGKVVDILSQSVSHLVRSQEGSSTGRTVVDRGMQWVFHQIPSGTLRPHVYCYVAAGCVVDPEGLIREMQEATSKGIEIVGPLHLSPHTHVIFPHHRKLDELREGQRGDVSMGITRGIAPYLIPPCLITFCLADRLSRVGIRLAELIRPNVFAEKLRAFMSHKSLDLEALFSGEGQIQRALISDSGVLFEGGGRALVNNVIGSYPYVASPSTLAAGICPEAGVDPNLIDEVFGVLKVYATRQIGERGVLASIEGNALESFEGVEELGEMGVAAGRGGRIGWFDLVAVFEAILLNGMGHLLIAKLDVLDQFAEIKSCVSYRLDGEEIDKLPPPLEDLACVEPIYEILPGWETSTRGVDKVGELLENARVFIDDAIEGFCNVAVAMISVGLGRDQTIEINERWI